MFSKVKRCPNLLTFAQILSLSLHYIPIIVSQVKSIKQRVNQESNGKYYGKLQKKGLFVVAPL